MILVSTATTTTGDPCRGCRRAKTAGSIPPRAIANSSREAPRKNAFQLGNADAATSQRRIRVRRRESGAGRRAARCARPFFDGHRRGSARQRRSRGDAAEWQPEHNQCWFAQRVIDVRMAYGLTIDRVEADAVDRILGGCTSTEIACESEPPEPEPEAEPEPEPVPDHPPIQSFRNCTLMRGAGWTRGVNINGGTYRPEWNDAERQTYQLNTGSDRDRDGHACE